MPAVVHRIRSPGLSIALALIASVMACAPASAQSLFQSLFGFGSPPPRPMPQYYPQRPVSPYYTPFGRSGQGYCA